MGLAVVARVGRWWTVLCLVTMGKVRFEAVSRFLRKSGRGASVSREASGGLAAAEAEWRS